MKSGYALVDAARIRQYKGLLQLVEWGLTHPDGISDAVCTLQDSMADGTDVKLAEAVSFHPTYQVLQKVPKYFRRCQLQTQFTSLPHELIVKIDQRDCQAVNWLWERWTGLGGGMKFHQCIKHKQVLDRTIKLHAAALPGPRLTGDMIRDGISDDGVIDEPKFHSYSIRKDLERQKLVAKHFLGDEADLPDCFYKASDDTANWNWNNEFSDHYAALVIDGVSVTISGHFTKGKGPKETKLANEKGKFLQDLGLRVRSDMCKDSCNTLATNLPKDLLEGMVTAKAHADQNDGIRREARTEEAKSRRRAAPPPPTPRSKRLCIQVDMPKTK